MTATLRLAAVIAALLLAGGFVVWSQRNANRPAPVPPAPKPARILAPSSKVGVFINAAKVIAPDALGDEEEIVEILPLPEPAAAAKP